MHQRDAAGAADVDRTIVGSIIPFAETKRLDSFCSTPCLLKDGIAIAQRSVLRVTSTLGI